MLVGGSNMNRRPGYDIPLDSWPALAQRSKEKKSGILIIYAGEKQGPDIARELLLKLLTGKQFYFYPGGKPRPGYIPLWQ